LRPEKTIVRLGDATIGGAELAIIAGPCAIESRQQAFVVAEAVKQSGARFFRGGVWKPRTSPYTFQGLGKEAWEILAEIREAFGLKIVTEAVDESHVDLIGSTVMSFRLVLECRTFRCSRELAGRSCMLLKRGWRLPEVGCSRPEIMAEGNYGVILCERGVRTFAQHTRNTLDLAPCEFAISIAES
jgi:3-deoxy-7-phosphoheptulonate synthase